MNRQRNRTRSRSPAALLAAVLLAVVASAAAADCTDRKPASATLVGVYTGETIAHGQVYRLPPVNVVVSRKTELARIEREEQRERDVERQARAKAARPAG